jgi:hypothetical protein
LADLVTVASLTSSEIRCSAVAGATHGVPETSTELALAFNVVVTSTACSHCLVSATDVVGAEVRIALKAEGTCRPLIQHHLGALAWPKVAGTNADIVGAVFVLDAGIAWLDAVDHWTADT